MSHPSQPTNSGQGNRNDAPLAKQEQRGEVGGKRNVDKNRKKMGTITNQTIEFATVIPEYDDDTKNLVRGMCYKPMDEPVSFSNMNVGGPRKKHIMLTVAAF